MLNTLSVYFIRYENVLLLIWGYILKYLGVVCQDVYNLLWNGSGRQKANKKESNCGEMVAIGECRWRVYWLLYYFYQFVQIWSFSKQKIGEVEKKWWCLISSAVGKEWEERVLQVWVFWGYLLVNSLLFKLVIVDFCY